MIVTATVIAAKSFCGMAFFPGLSCAERPRRLRPERRPIALNNYRN